MIEILLLSFLIILNGVFSMSEIAVISSRQARLQKMSDDKRRGAQSALALNRDPAKFLSTVQVGITTVGILSGAIGQTALADPLTLWLENMPQFEPYAREIALTLVVVGLTYVSVVIGELVPKQLGLRAPEKIASMIAAPMNGLSRITQPLVWLLTVSSSILLRLLGASRKPASTVTNEEIKVLMEQGAAAGIFHSSEKEIVSNVLRLDEQRIGKIMTHRNEIAMLDLAESESEIHKRIAESPYTRIVVCNNGPDNIVGILRTQDILKEVLAGKPLDIKPFLRRPLYVPEGVTTTRLLENFRAARQQFALIVDEYGELQGLVTLTDVLISIVGEIPTSDIPAEQDIVKRDDGSWLVDGSVTIERMQAVLGIKQPLLDEESTTFNTIGGLVMHRLDRIPMTNDHFELSGYRFEVMDMDKNRVDKVLVSRVVQANTDANKAAPNV